MSKFVGGTFTFDEPPCYCKADPKQTPWNWGLTNNALYIECPRCKVKVHVTHNEWRMGIKFNQEHHYDVVDDCKIIPFRKT